MPKIKLRRLNTQIIGCNAAEAAEELASLQHKLFSGTINEAELQVSLLHAFHHLNFAWNVRRVRTQDYATLIQEQFEKWGKYPLDIAL